MTKQAELDILRKEEEFCNKLWDSNYQEELKKGNKYTSLNHQHVCDFELCNFKYCKNIKKLNKLVEQKCRKYLSSIGKERDKYMECCDNCIHDRYLTISDNTEDLVLNICTSGLDYRFKQEAKQ